ncbi:DUF4123 domain-containing protein [uncultured Herbaspirillum sp.]|uniref:DUF4123 domain-containing protein n=1 Tax=uncultured Herbaspirillum sp. TaxID=160236 RepID=UPI00258BF206|nr:DUF4123 domain-containing protein [uncultured Herbaspirillum sp.]
MENEQLLTTVPAWDRHLNALHRLIAEESDGQCLLWLNPLAHQMGLAGTKAKECVAIPIEHPRFDRRFAPSLLPLDLQRYEDSEIFANSVAMAWTAWDFETLQASPGQPIAGWVIGSMSAKELAGHWARSVCIHHEKGQSRLLRFNDPAVREWLWPTLTPTQKSTLIGSADALISIGRQQQIELARRELDMEYPQPQERSWQAPLKLSATQWYRLEHYAEIHAAWMYWLSEGGDRHQILSQDCIFSALLAATERGLSHPDDRILFIFHLLQLGEIFYHDARLESVWERTRLGEAYSESITETLGLSAQHLAQFLTDK